ncbi:FAD-dependent monooxygenase [Robbsia andropogonis]|uniref:FAD-dependent monooxygenase n=1 Tax=Robbsia andropogonis TaxID=28092 RepID=UPI000A3F0176|nr:FAD-dependent monooxygenase [Robbsia andropogonis]
MAKNTLDIIVAGAGIGGLGVALALQQAGHRVRLFERTRALRPVGAAISVWPNGVKVLRALGVGAPLDAAAGKMDRMSYHDRDGGLMARFSLQPLYDKVQERAKPIARMALQQLLLDAVGAHHVQLGATCERYEQDGAGVTVHLTNGSTHRADLFVVSDGSRSRLRDQVAGQVISRRYRGYVNWNGRIRIAPELGVADEWTQFVGDHRRVSLMPMGGDAFYFSSMFRFLTRPSWVSRWNVGRSRQTAPRRWRARPRFQSKLTRSAIAACYVTISTAGRHRYGI